MLAILEHRSKHRSSLQVASWEDALGGWSDNTQSVDLDGSSSVQHRVIYSVRKVPEQRIQFGTVKVDYGTVAVWRPFDPDNTGPDAPWRTETWRNVYRIHVPQYPIPKRSKYVEYHIGEVAIDELWAKLPLVELRVSYWLREYLKSV